MSNVSYWVYILLCENHTYYTGYTNDLEKRYTSHVEGTGRCKYTRSFKPIKIAQSWEIKEGKLKAMQVERYIKKLSRVDKDKLINNPNLLEQI
ncbi:GIY-YIG nuclease family protein [Legionella sp. WA2022007384]